MHKSRKPTQMKLFGVLIFTDTIGLSKTYIVFEDLYMTKFWGKHVPKVLIDVFMRTDCSFDKWKNKQRGKASNGTFRFHRDKIKRYVHCLFWLYRSHLQGVCTDRTDSKNAALYLQVFDRLWKRVWRVHPNF